MATKVQLPNSHKIIKVDYEVMFKHILNTDLSDLEIDTHTYNILYNKGIHIVRHLVCLSYKRLRGLKGIGVKRSIHLLMVLEDMGLSLNINPDHEQ